MLLVEGHVPDKPVDPVATAGWGLDHLLHEATRSVQPVWLH